MEPKYGDTDLSTYEIYSGVIDVWTSDRRLYKISASTKFIEAALLDTSYYGVGVCKSWLKIT